MVSDSVNFADAIRLLLLSAIWGASFLFMRIAGPDFGPFPLILIRVAGAALVLSPVFFEAQNRALFRRHLADLAIVGVLGTALPFCLFAFATLRLEAGFTSLLNATTPMFTAVIGAIWFHSAFRKIQILGLAVAFVGVAILSGDRFSFEAGGAAWEILAVLAATLAYAFSTNFTKKRLHRLPPKLIATGTLVFATLALLPLGIWLWPEQPPGAKEWGCLAALSLLCTAIAFLLFFRVLRTTGAMATTTVTFLIPVFGIWWGWLILEESIGPRLVIGMLVILLGTAMAIGLFGRARASRRP